MTMPVSRLRSGNRLLISRFADSFAPSRAGTGKVQFPTLLTIPFDALLLGQLIAPFRQIRVWVTLGIGRVVCGFAQSQYFGCRLYRIDYLLVSGAPAKITLYGALNLIIVWLRILFQ